MTAFHPDLAAGRWHAFSLSEQLGNVGSEVGRALSAKGQGRADRLERALARSLELLDLTIADPKHRGRTRELCRLREVLCDYLVGDNEYRSTAASIDKYFLAFAVYARRKRVE